MRATDLKASPTCDCEEPLNTEKRVDVSAEELRHLAECCAFFKADHFREAAPETIRAADIVAAEVEIEQVIETRGCCGVPRNRREDKHDHDR